MKLMARVTIIAMLSMVSLLETVIAQEEIYTFEAGSGRRTGSATLRIEPELSNKRSNIYFETKQSGVSHTNKFRLAI